MKLKISLSATKSNRRKPSPITKIIRGMNVRAKFKDIASAHKLYEGTLSAEEILKFVRKRVGVWWYLYDEDNSTHIEDEDYGYGLEDARDFAEREDDITRGIGKYLYEEFAAGREKKMEVELPIVLIAKRPEGWNPNDNPNNAMNDYGLNGNSYINTRKWKTIELLEVQYLSSKGWVSHPIHKTVQL